MENKFFLQKLKKDERHLFIKSKDYVTTLSIYFLFSRIN